MTRRQCSPSSPNPGAAWSRSNLGRAAGALSRLWNRAPLCAAAGNGYRPFGRRLGRDGLQLRPASPRDSTYQHGRWSRAVHYQRGRSSWNLAPDLLTDAAGRFGRSATTPMLWVFSQNDRYLDPAIAATLYDAFTRNGGKAEFEEVGPYGNDGHRLFFGAGGSQIWGPLVANYLARQPAQ